jgi:tRNA (guanine37-N1)-methyltransferase
MKIRVITIFPEFFAAGLGEGLLGKAADKGLVQVETDDLRAYAGDRHHTVDDQPYGGGPGMVMKVDVWDAALTTAREALPGCRVVLLSPQGQTLTDGGARRLANEENLVLCCGRYEGVDERVAEHLVDEQLSIGDYVLTGGEAAALVVIDAVARKLPGVVGRSESVERDTFTAGLKFPQYTRPPSYREWAVPEVLMSGDHGAIESWRLAEAERRTRERRPELVVATLPGRLRLVAVEPSAATLAALPELQRAYGLAIVAAAIADPEARAAAEKAYPAVKFHGQLANAGRRWSEDEWIHLADAPGPGQLSFAQARHRAIEQAAGVTVSFGGPAPRGAAAAAPALVEAPKGLPALVAWLDRLVGR